MLTEIQVYDCISTQKNDKKIVMNILRYGKQKNVRISSIEYLNHLNLADF